MSSGEHDKELRPEDGSEADGSTGQRPPDIERAGAPDPFQLEGEDSGEKPDGGSHVKALDVCPNCGAPMPDAKTLVCLRCGFDLKRLEVIKTSTGETEVDDEEDDGPKKKPPLTVPGRGGLWMPAVLAAVAVALLLLGYLAGVPNLFPKLEAAPTLAQKFTGLLRAALLIPIWAGCGLGGLFFQSRLLERPVGDLQLAAVRMLGISAAMRLMVFVRVGPAFIAWPLLAIAEAAVFCGLTMVFFGLALRDAATTTLATLISFVVLWIAALAVNWAAASGF